MPENTLYYGDNLDVLRRYVPDESVDLIYLDPPFKSQQDYNVLDVTYKKAPRASEKQAVTMALPLGDADDADEPDEPF
jgi:site-specific DNA-methyltransferase (adenine-specific)